MTDALLDTLSFTTAKSHLSDVMTGVVHRHELKIVGRRDGKEQMLLVGRDDVLGLLDAIRFEPVVTVSEGEFVIELPELNLILAGETFDAALGELVELASTYAEQYLRRRSFYAETEQRSQLPWVLKIALSRGDERRGLFTQPPAGAQPRAV